MKLNLFLTINDKKAKDYFYINFISIITSLTIGFLIIISRVGLEDLYTSRVLKILLLSSFMLLFPAFLVNIITRNKERLSRYSSYDAFFFLMLSLVIFLPSPAFIVIGLLAVISFIYFGVIFLKYQNTKNTIYLFLIFIVFSTFISFYLWGARFLTFYSSPVFYERLYTGTAFIDPIFHGAVSNMIKTFGVPSTGLDGAVYLPYHFLSHWVFANISKLLNMNTLLFYQIGYPVIFIPLFIKYFLLTTRSLTNSRLPNFIQNKFFWLIFLAAFSGFLPKHILERFFVTEFVFLSESYNLSITFTLILVLIILFFEGKALRRKWINCLKTIFYLVGLPVFIFLIGLTKSSTMVLLMVLLFYLFLRFGYYKKVLYAISAILCIGSAASLFMVVSNQEGGTFSLELFHFFKTSIQIRNENLHWLATLLLFIIIYFFWSILFIILEAKRSKLKVNSEFINKFRDKDTLKIEVVLLTCITGLLPGIVLKIPGGSANYFSDIQRWLSIIFILSLAAHDFRWLNVKRKLNKSFSIFVTILLLASIAYNLFAEFRSYYDNNHKTKKQYIEIMQKTQLDPVVEYRKKLLDVLIGLQEMPLEQKREMAIYIPADNTIFWELKLLYKSLSVPLIIPSITGMAMVDGIPSAGLIYNNSFGYSSYDIDEDYVKTYRPIEEVFEEAKDKGFTKILVLDYKKDKIFRHVLDETNYKTYNTDALLERLVYFGYGESKESNVYANFVENINSGNQTLQDIITDVILNKSLLINDMDNSDFIEMLYLVLVSRGPDEEGLRNWVSLLEEGLSREKVVENFLSSEEFISKNNL